VTDDKIIEIEANAATVHVALDRFLELATERVGAAARITADNVRAEAQKRIRRRTGQTAAGIVVRALANGGYWVVAEGAPGQPLTHRGAPAVPVWLEYGARSMRFGPKPFLFVSGQLEATAHEGRVSEAIESAIVDAGLGE
jgi:hypothetical protein